MLDRCRPVLLLLAVAGALGGRAEAQSTIREELVDQFNALFPPDHSRPMTVSEACCRLDCLAKELRKSGLVLIKQPDVFSQARMTRFRNDFENQLSTDLANFHLVLAARINRLDSATTQSATALGAALSAPGTTNVQAPSAGSNSAAASLLSPTTGLFPSTPLPSLFNGASSPGLFNNLTTGPSTLPPSAASAAALTLGVDPTVYLDEKKRFLDYLNHLRRLNLGPDQNDSSGYGLYLVRLPVSVIPGEGTYQGHGADLSVQVEHEFTPDFLPSAFRRLVINDIIDQLGPFLYEIIRSGYYDNVLKPRFAAQGGRGLLRLAVAEMIAAQAKQIAVKDPNAIAEALTAYILRAGFPLQGNLQEELAIQYRRDALAGYARHIPPDRLDKPLRPGDGADPDQRVEAPLLRTDPELRERIRAQVQQIIRRNPEDPRFRDFLLDLYELALPDDLKVLDDLLAVSQQQRAGITQRFVKPVDTLVQTSTSQLNVSLPSSRTAKQSYPIKPREFIQFFGEENIYLLAHEVLEASRQPKKTIRSSEIRDYLRQLLDPAYDWMAKAPDQPGAPPPPLADDEFMAAVRWAVQQRNFGSNSETLAGRQGADAPPEISKIAGSLVNRLEVSRCNIRQRPFQALCWAVAVDSALLDTALKADARRVFADNGQPVEPIDAVHFYRPYEYCDQGSRDIFCQYVRLRWPIITFSLDPVTDQQNIADSFSLNRDLQLAVSFAFATGQINFSQVNSFRRQLQQSSDTIALNRTITGFMQGNDTFGFRFTPRFQNPPNQATNLGVITSQLISGGPGPNYQMRKSKLEPGIRELNAVLLIPTFLPVMRMNVSTNWFKLTDPEQLVHHTGKMMERGRQVQELRDAVQVLCNAEQYREADLRVLLSKMAQLDTMLPMQSRVVQLPYENSAAGFDLFIDGSSALVPELTGFSGVDIISVQAPSSAGATGTSAGSSNTGTAATPGTATTPAATPTFSITSLSTPNSPAVTTYTMTGGSTADADVFVFGKYISLLDTRVIAGGRSASFEILSREVLHVQIPQNAMPTTTEDGQTYVEVYVATPNGISNSLLIPCQPPNQPAAPAKVAYDVGTTPALDIYYQWLPGPDGRAMLAPSTDPSKNSVTITWDSDTGLAPRQIQAQFAATLNNQNIVIELSATASTTGDYTIDGTLFTMKLLERLQSITTYPAIPSTPLTFTVTVLPWTPADPQGLRAINKPKTLPTKLTVNLQYNAVGPQQPPAPKPSGGDGSGAWRLSTPGTAGGVQLASPGSGQDPSVVRTAQSASLPTAPTIGSQSIPSFLRTPEPPPVLSAPTLLAPNVASEAEQLSKIMSGQPIAPRVIGPNMQGLPALPPTVTSQMPTVIVNPAPVTVVAPPSTNARAKKHTSAIHRMFNRMGNRASSAMPSQ